MPGFGKISEEAAPAVQGLANNVAGLGSVITAVGGVAGSTFAQIQQGIAQTMTAFERMRQLLAGGQAAFEQTQVGGIEQLLGRLQSAEESNPDLALGFSQLIENELERVASGQTTIAQAIQDLMRYLGNQYGLIQREFTLSTDASIRQLGQDILQFINSGQTPAAAAQIGAGAGAPVPAARQLGPGGGSTAGFGAGTGGSVSAGFGGATDAATREDLVGLGATITRANREQADRLAAGIPTPQEVAEAVRTRMTPDLRQFYDQAAAFSEEMERNLSMTLERFAVSGALAPGAR